MYPCSIRRRGGFRPPLPECLNGLKNPRCSTLYQFESGLGHWFQAIMQATISLNSLPWLVYVESIPLKEL